MSDPGEPIPNLESGVMVETDTPPSFEEFGSNSHTPDAGSGGSLSAVHEVPVRVQAVLGRARVPVGELIRMKSGMVLELDRRVGEPVDVYVNNRLVARGEVMLVDHALGVTLTEIVRQDG
ncbi:flagellar motor switch protein FliN [Sphingomonas sp. R647]|uniref:flagellar motor switch protein FliN n=1 Tax=Sphingomonas sp. R647 TaxID=2875233 RepID=UPI001CD5BB92|nr:flagellar motor switch protein FliN [Sphingomonas sp. R647]MCA1199035.1 flagellar motor switch protein FliN [Sphingomonas sp. R647]